MDKLTKFLNKQPKKNRLLVFKLLDKFLKGDFKGCNIIKLTGFDDLYRLKKGRIRIIFKKNGDIIVIQKVTLRDEKTYDF